jgi:hypothetical protein
MKPPHISRLAAAAGLWHTIGLHSRRVIAVDTHTERCVEICAETGIPNCVSVCRFFHRTPTEGGAIALPIDGTDEDVSTSVPYLTNTNLVSNEDPNNDTAEDLLEYTESDEDVAGRRDESSFPSQSPATQPRVTESPTDALTYPPSIMPSPKPFQQIPSDMPSDVPSSIPSDVISTVAPTHVPTTHSTFSLTWIPSDTPSVLPSTVLPALVPTTTTVTDSDTSTAHTEPTISSIQEDSTAEEENDQAQEKYDLSSTIPACNFDKKVGYQCGDDTFVCNTDQYVTASEVCNAQPISLDGGRLYDWKDLDVECSHDDVVTASNFGRNSPACWCRGMAAGVSTQIREKRRSFPSNVTCPNGRSVVSYVCYFPTQGGKSFKVNQWDESGTGERFVTECTGFQIRESLSSVKESLVNAP